MIFGRDRRDRPCKNWYKYQPPQRWRPPKETTAGGRPPDISTLSRPHDGHLSVSLMFTIGNFSPPSMIPFVTDQGPTTMAADYSRIHRLLKILTLILEQRSVRGFMLRRRRIGGNCVVDALLRRQLSGNRARGTPQARRGRTQKGLGDLFIGRVSPLQRRCCRGGCPAACSRWRGGTFPRRARPRSTGRRTIRAVARNVRPSPPR